ncbi:hypothetical protein Acr_06g0005380 [Actinidia rufa]|uniref:Uncharacterized protein n=1 Tax=Actinidia rufa TaxID=165716 RepID=A0A7J0EQ46_9ERIC|nr:hypothetical protein Acr_06g0005380 [Actinidia rufa]
MIPPLLFSSLHKLIHPPLPHPHALTSPPFENPITHREREKGGWGDEGTGRVLLERRSGGGAGAAIESWVALAKEGEKRVIGLTR